MIAPETLLQNRYLVQKQIGQGGMGAVYLAIDQRFGSTVALKETFFDDPNLRKAFEREARLLNHLRHPALPRVSDHFTEGDGQFLVMEFIPGADLSEQLKEKRVPFPLHEVLTWADQLLDALEYLHTHEPPVIHRDIKPQNLKLTDRNHIVLLDFGLAKGTPLQVSRVTATGSVFGYSFNYAPLEQMQGTGTDPRSDLYSLSATVYHLMTGTTPPDALSRATAVLNGEPDPLRPANEVHIQVPAPVARVLASAMAQSAAQRPQTAAAMRAALREAAKQDNAPIMPAVVQSISDTSLQEQNTKLLGEATGKPAAGVATNVKAAGTVGGLLEAATVIQPTPSASASSPNTEHQAGHSIATQTRAAQPQRKSTVSMLAVVMSVLLLAVVAAGAVYLFTRKPASQTPGVQTTPSPSDTATPAPAATVEAQNPSPTPAPVVAPTTTQVAPTVTQQAVNPSSKAPKAKSPATAAKAQPNEPDSDEDENQPDTPERPRPPGLSPEQRAEIKESIREAKREQREAELKRKEALRLQRQQQRQQQFPRRENPFPRKRNAPPPY